MEEAPRTEMAYAPGGREEPPFTRRVSFEERDDAGGRNVTRTGLLVFESFSERKEARPGGVADEKLVEITWSSPIALFASEIAEEAGVSRERASGILFRLTGGTPPLVMRRGWRRRTASGSGGLGLFDGEGSRFTV